MAWFQGSVWQKIRGGLEYVPGVIKAIKSAKIVTLPELQGHIFSYTALRSARENAAPSFFYSLSLKL